MTLDEALQFADVCDNALTHHKPIFDGPVKVISVLAAEVRRLRASPAPLTDELRSKILELCTSYEMECDRTMIPGDEHDPLISEIREMLGAGK